MRWLPDPLLDFALHFSIGFSLAARYDFSVGVAVFCILRMLYRIDVALSKQ